MNRKWISAILAAIFFATGFPILFQQYVTFGVFFQLKDMLHHEAFAIAAVALGIGILIGSVVASKE
jgi:hypothetical protein